VALALRFLDAPGPLILDKRREWEAKQDFNGNILGEKQLMKPSDEQWKEAMAAVKLAKKPRREQKQAINVDLFAEQSKLNHEATTDTAAPIDPFGDVFLSVASEENKNPMPKRVSSQEKGDSALISLIGKRIDEHEESEAPYAGGSASGSSHMDQDSSTKTADSPVWDDDVIFQERGENVALAPPMPQRGAENCAFAPIPEPGADRFTENTRLVN